MAKLYVVGTPIGNFGDLSPRAKEVLTSCQLIAAEDTRITKGLLTHFGISTPCISNHRHNEEGRAGQIVQRMQEEDIDVALVTDAGMPGISDPGSFLVDEAIRAGIEVLSVPGPSAMASALSVSGFDTRTFAFYGFPPRKPGELRSFLKQISRGPVPVAVLHESPHRVIDLVKEIAETIPETYISASCDLTKLYEKTIRGTAGKVLEMLQANEKAEKGEYCLVLDMHEVPAPEQTVPQVSAELQLLSLMMDGADLNTAAVQLRQQGLKRNELYAAKEKVKALLEGRLE